MLLGGICVESGKNHSKPAIGFLTVIDHPQHGLFGGYLVLNLAGRPLEFHCTAPIKPNRAQQILYGPTLESFLYGEQIGSTLLGHAKTSPLAICTDREPVLSLRDLVDLPVALVLPPEDRGNRTGRAWKPIRRRPSGNRRPAMRRQVANLSYLRCGLMRRTAAARV